MWSSGIWNLDGCGDLIIDGGKVEGCLKCRIAGLQDYRIAVLQYCI